jgi:hypothetical protein
MITATATASATRTNAITRRRSRRIRLGRSADETLRAVVVAWFIIRRFRRPRCRRALGRELSHHNSVFTSTLGDVMSITSDGT